MDPRQAPPGRRSLALDVAFRETLSRSSFGYQVGQAVNLMQRSNSHGHLGTEAGMRESSKEPSVRVGQKGGSLKKVQGLRSLVYE